MKNACFLKKFKELKIANWIELKNIIKNYDIIINATSLGLKNGEDFNFNFEEYKKSLIYIDTIYNPLETKTLKYLKEREVKFLVGLICLFIKAKKLFIFE